MKENKKILTTNKEDLSKIDELSEFCKKKELRY